MDRTPRSTSNPSVARRSALGTGAGAVMALGAGLFGPLDAATPAAAALPPTSASTPPAAGDEFDRLRGVWSDILTGGPLVDPADPAYASAIETVDSAAQAAIALYDRSASPASVYTDLPFTQVENASATYGRIQSTALAWATPGSRFHQDPQTASDLVAALALIGSAYYHAGAAEVGNWYHWEIACPQGLLNSCVLLGDAVPADALTKYVAATDYFSPDPTHQQKGTTVTTGANRSDLSVVTILRGILAKDGSQIALGRDALSGIFPYVTSGDGYYADGGFIQHATIPYNGHYSYVMLNDLSQLAVLLTGSIWQITDPGLQVVLDAVELGYAPFMNDGLAMDVVRGRFLSRQGETDHDAGHAITEAVLRLVPAGSREQQRRWKALAKGWIVRERYAPISAGATPERIALVKSVLDDPLVAPAEQGPGHLQIPSIERAVHRRPGWSWAVALSSSRIARFEAINGENQRGWHTGDGATYLYTADDGHYTDAYWPTVDCTRLPGTTTDTLALAPSAGSGTLPTTTWSGGAVLQERFGAVGLDLQPYGSPLRARKSWFCLDDGVVALGAGITGSSGHTVETTVENRNLHSAGTRTLTVDGAAQPSAPGWNGSFPGARWAHLDGVGGYLLPGGATLHALCEERTGAWADIDSGPSTKGTTTPYTNRYVTLWLDHGVDPSDASYAYVLLPGASARQTALAAARQDAIALANTPSLQAVRVRSAGLIAANFFAAGTLTGSVSADGPACVLLREESGSLTVAVSDPTGTSSSLTLTLEEARGYRRALSDDPGVSVSLSGPQPVVTVDLTRGRQLATRAVTLYR